MSEDNQDVKILTLRKPVIIGSGSKAVTYDVLTLDEPTAGALGKASRESSSTGGLLTLISQVAGVPREVAAALCSRDLDDADEILSGYTIDQPDFGDEFVDEYLLTLRRPIELGGGTIIHQTLTLAEPSGGEKEKASREATETLQAIALIAVVAKVPKVVAERLRKRDFEEACYFLASCRSAGRQTGAR